MTRRRPRGLRSDEAQLWRKIAGTARPLHPERPPDPAPRPAPPPTETAAPPPSAPWPSFDVGEAAGGRGRTDVRPAPDPGEALDAAPLRMDRRTHTRLKRGKVRPEGRLDLHGMKLDEAHPALVSYVLGARADGKRVLLVITGKGRGARPDEPFSRRGVLRHQVPVWLAAPPLSAIVQQVVPAHQSHGGGGAYYVYLRRGR